MKHIFGPLVVSGNNIVTKRGQVINNPAIVVDWGKHLRNDNCIYGEYDTASITYKFLLRQRDARDERDKEVSIIDFKTGDWKDTELSIDEKCTVMNWLIQGAGRKEYLNLVESESLSDDIKHLNDIGY